MVELQSGEQPKYGLWRSDTYLNQAVIFRGGAIDPHVDTVSKKHKFPFAHKPTQYGAPLTDLDCVHSSKRKTCCGKGL